MNKGNYYLLPFLLSLAICGSSVFAHEYHHQKLTYTQHHYNHLREPFKPKQDIASWYGRNFHTRRTSNGERYNMYQMTAAHKTLPFNTKLRVTNLLNGRSTIVRINDRGPYIRGRTIDLSYAAARELHMVSRGVAPVKIENLHHKA